jgi:hypothetical protein
VQPIAFSAVRLGVDAFALRGATTDVLGDVSLGLYGGALSIGVGTTGASIRGGVAARVDVAVLSASGAPTSAIAVGSSGSSVALTAAADARLHFRLDERWLATTALSAGSALRSVRADSDGRTSGGIAGALFGVAVGITLQL